MAIEPLANAFAGAPAPPPNPPQSSIAPKKTGVAKSTPASDEDTADIIFPPTLRDQLNRPCIEFSAATKTAKGLKIWLPCPPNIAINDSAQYNTIDLGTLGGAIAGAAQAASNSSSGFSNTMGTVASSIAAQAQNLKGSEIAALATGMIASDDMAQKANFAARVVVNPNTNTTFSSNSIRAFSFAFRLVATSPEEAKLIRRLHNRFRTYTYADSKQNAQNIILKYPPVWTIKFLDPEKNENPFIPKLYSCYLETLQVTINNDSSVFHTDGAPLEVDMTLNFKETRALTRTDIVELEKGLLPNRGIVNGVPSVQSNANAILPQAKGTAAENDGNGGS